MIWSTVPEIYIERDRLKLVILSHFLPFYPPKNPNNQYFEKMKKTAGDIIILLRCPKNHNHTMYGSWDTEGDKFFLSIWAIFYSLPPSPPNDPENQNF